METLKKIRLIFAFSCISILVVSAQTKNLRHDYITKSYEYERANNYTAAMNELKKTYQAEDYFINIRLGWLNYLAKQYSEAIKYYEKAIVLKPYAIEAKFGSIKPLSAIEDWEKVKVQYLQILKIDPQNTVANYWLGVIYYNRKDYNNAVKLFERVVNLYPLDYDSVVMLAWTKLNLGKAVEAKILFKQALILRPNDSAATSGLKLIK